ncbi:MAG: HU family DNA-binding protein [Myxococcota bacterium]
MTKAELVDLICQKHEVNKKTGAEILETVFDTVLNAIKSEEKFTYPGFGTFTVRQRKERMGTDPRTKQQIKIPASKTVGFKPAKAFKDAL